MPWSHLVDTTGTLPALSRRAREAARLALVAVASLAAVTAVAGPASAAGSDPVAEASVGLEDRRYTLVPLEGLGGTASSGLGIDDLGIAHGTARTGTATRPQVAVRWDRDGRATSLGTLPGSTFSRAFASNGRGLAVGEAFTPSPEVSRAVAWDGDAIRDLGTSDGASGAVANDVNARGQIVGVSGGRAVVWDHAGQPRSVGTLGSGTGVTSRGTAASDRGHVAGSSSTDVTGPTGSRVTHAFVATPRGRGFELVDLGSLAGPQGFSQANDVDARGRVVGESISALGATSYRGVLWRGRGAEELAPVGGRTHSVANAIGPDAEVVGASSGFRGFATIDGLATLWVDGTAIDLNTLVEDDLDGWVLRTAEDVNLRGQIVGTATFDGQTRAFRLDPAPR
jgi:uncharacterized membrane protein